MRGTTVTIVALACALGSSPALGAPVLRPGGNYYEYVASASTWAAAESYAEGKHARLVTIADAPENAFVLGMVASAPAWIGASDDGNDTDSVFTWVTGEQSTFANFAAGEPDDDVGSTGMGEALALQADGTWIDTNPNVDTFVQGYVIEWTDDLPDLDGDGLYGNADPDDDNDSVADGTDNCAQVANADQANADGDAQGDVCDADDDGDGTPDLSDAFPLDPARSQADPGPVAPEPLADPTPSPAPSGGATVADTKAPAVSARTAATTLRLGALLRSRQVSLVVSTDEAADVVVRGSLRKRKVGSASFRSSARVARSVSLRLARAMIRRGSLTITVVASDAAGNVGQTSLVIRIR